MRDDVNPTVLSTTGTIVIGQYNFNVTYTPASGDPTVDGWNLVGNPYPAPLNWDDLWTNGSTNVSQVMSITDNGSGVTATYDALLNVGLNGGTPEIAMGQAFWVQTTAASPSLVAQEAYKSTTTPAFLRVASPENVTKISVTDGKVTDETAIVLYPGTELAFDNLDGRKFKNETFNFSSMSADGQKLSFNYIPPSNDPYAILLDLSDADAGHYKMEFNNISNDLGNNVLLVDHYLNREIDLSKVSSYEFDVSNEGNSYGSSRFSLLINSGRKDQTISEADILVYPNPVNNVLSLKIFDPLDANSSLQLIDNQGKVLLYYNIKSDLTEVDVNDLPTGIYFLRVINGNRSFSRTISKE